MKNAAPTRDLVVFSVLIAPVVAWSAWAPKDRLTWWLEVAPVFAGLGLAWAVRGRFALSRLLLVLLWLHAVILLIGGHYTYAEVPLGEWVRELTGGERNNYDKLGHFAQGFVPVLLTREILLRTSPLGDADGRPASAWLGFLCGSVALAFSALYELIEWVAAEVSEEGAEAFLGTQGYVWDTQTDMALALAGAVVALVVVGRAHGKAVERAVAEKNAARA
jgi:putative membrane protein